MFDEPPPFAMPLRERGYRRYLRKWGYRRYLMSTCFGIRVHRYQPKLPPVIVNHDIIRKLRWPRYDEVVDDMYHYAVLTRYDETDTEMMVVVGPFLCHANVRIWEMIGMPDDLWYDTWDTMTTETPFEGAIPFDKVDRDIFRD